MNRFVKAVILTDGAILLYGFARPVWFIDYRWHKNQYDQAATVMSAGLAVDVAGTVAMIAHHPDLFAFVILPTLTAMLVWMYGFYLKRLGEASRAYERDPSRLHRSQSLFHFIFFPPLRLFLVSFGLFLGLGELPVALTFPSAYEWFHFATTFWMVLIGASMYVAGVPHTPFERKKKKERAMLGAPLLSPSA